MCTTGDKLFQAGDYCVFTDRQGGTPWMADTDIGCKIQISVDGLIKLGREAEKWQTDQTKQG